MTENLIKQYGEIVNEILLYEKFVTKDLTLSLNPIEIISAFNDEVTWIKDIFNKKNTTWLGVGLYHEKNTKKNQEDIRKRFTAEEAKNPFYAIARDDYPLDALSAHLHKKYPSVDFAKLLDIHEEWSSSSLIAKLSSFVTFTSGISLLPDFIRNFDNFWDSGNSFLEGFQEFFSDTGIISAIFSLLLIALFISGLLVSLSLFIYSRNKRNKIKRVLKYTAIRKGQL